MLIIIISFYIVFHLGKFYKIENNGKILYNQQITQQYFLLQEPGGLYDNIGFNSFSEGHIITYKHFMRARTVQIQFRKGIVV